MRYRNTRTGVTIDVASVIAGKNWVPVAEIEKQAPPLEIEEEQIFDSEDYQEMEEKEEVETNTGFDKITRAQIMQELDAFGIEYDPKMKKQDLYNLMMSHGE